MGTAASRSSSLLRPVGALLLWSDYLGLRSDFPLHSTASDSRLRSFVDSPLRSNAIMGFHHWRRRSKKKLKYWKAFCVVILPRRIARVYGEIAKRVKIMENVCPAILFSSSQWGLPVLSHSPPLL
nr:TRNA-specific 2-thiouridylase [Ipomoea batatas]